jgi:hypothetical protein
MNSPQEKPISSHPKILEIAALYGGKVIPDSNRVVFSARCLKGVRTFLLPSTIEKSPRRSN